MRRRQLITSLGALVVAGCATRNVPLTHLPYADVPALVADLRSRADGIRVQPLPAELLQSTAEAGLPATALNDVLVGLLVSISVRELDQKARSHPDLQAFLVAELAPAGRALLGLARWLRGLDRDERKRFADTMVGDESLLGRLRTDLRVEGERAGVPQDRLVLLEQTLDQLSWTVRKQGPDPVCDELVAVTEKASEAEGLPVASWDDAIATTPRADGSELLAALVAQLDAERSEHGAPEAMPADDRGDSLEMRRSARMARTAARMFGLSLGVLAASGLSLVVAVLTAPYGGGILAVGGVLGLTAGVVLAIIGLVYLVIAGTTAMTEGPSEVEVLPHGDWVSTGLRVSADHPLLLEVTGTLVYVDLTIGPAGQADVLPPELCLNATLPALALIGLVNGEVFFVGPTPVDPPAQGELSLAVNAAAVAGVQGGFTVRVRK